MDLVQRRGHPIQGLQTPEQLSVILFHLNSPQIHLPIDRNEQ